MPKACSKKLKVEFIGDNVPGDRAFRSRIPNPVRLKDEAKGSNRGAVF